jgi:hypothetical protein
MKSRRSAVGDTNRHSSRRGRRSLSNLQANLECFEELRSLIFGAGTGMTSQQDARADELRSQVVALRRHYLRHARSRATDTES